MRLEPYRKVLALPGVRSLMLVAMLARVPVTAAGVTLTLHVVLDLGGTYGAAGLVGAAATVGSALGAPLLGRLVDRRGLRLMLGLTIVAEATFWAVAPVLPYAALLVAAGVGGLLTMPVFSVVRQSIAALVPGDARRQAYALDSMAVELSFMIGPAVAVLVITQVSARVTMYAVGTAIVLAGVALFVLNPPVRAADEPVAGQPVRRRSWLRPRLIGVLVLSAATTSVLSGTDIALVAELRAAGQVQWTGVVMACWGAYSMAGGFVYGAVPRVLPTVLLLALLGAFTMPVGLVDGWGWLALALLPAGALCAPTLAATADAVSRMVPAGARGEAMGWHGSALTLGLAAGAPLAGAVIDLGGPALGFAVVGGVGLAAAVALLPFQRASGTPPGQEPSRDVRDTSGAPAGPAYADASAPV